MSLKLVEVVVLGQVLRLNVPAEQEEILRLLKDDCIQPLNMRNIKTNRDWAGIFGNKWDEYR